MFVSIGIASGVAGPSVILAIVLAGLLAGCNALSSAQLAANHPVSGGTYAYGRRYLTPTLGFAAGWLFLCAKSASAAAAALGVAGYALHATGSGLVPATAGIGWRVGLALATVVLVTGLVVLGVRRSNRANAVIVGVTLVSLACFVAVGLGPAWENGRANLTPFFGGDGAGGVRGLLGATALMFVAYTGYGRLATLGEEVTEPRRTIPRAIVWTLAISMAVYLAVGLVGVAGAGVEVLGGTGLGGTGLGGTVLGETERGWAGTTAAAPLEAAVRGFGAPWAGPVLAAGAVAAMLGVLLNLVLGLSRVVLAMGRAGDLPRSLGRLDARANPTAAVVGVGLVIGLIAATGSVRLAWSFSAFTVLVYYALTNLAALRLTRQERLYHPVFAWVGLTGCLGLAFWVEPRAWASGLVVLGLGLAGRGVVLLLRGRKNA